MGRQVQTVTGRIDAENLGPTLMHEHILSDITGLFEPPMAATERSRAFAPISLENLGWIRRNYFKNHPNLILDDLDTAIDELKLFFQWGGGTIVELTMPGIGRDPVGIAQIARTSGVNIVIATGYYVAATHPSEVSQMTADQITELMLSEFQIGVRIVHDSHDDWMERHDSTGIKAGIIKVGCTWPLVEAEKKVLIAAANAQRESGMAITIHCGRDERSPMEILDFLEEAGAEIGRVILGHLDLRVQRDEVIWELAERGCYLQFDGFGTESSFYGATPFDMPSDGQRLDRIMGLIGRGGTKQILISQDIAMKYRLRRYGGHGYHHILENVVPFMRKKMMAEEDIHQILAVNPGRVLALV